MIMISSENHENELSTSDERTVTSARESLTTLLRKDNCSPEEISLALEYLTELRNRIIDVGERRPALQNELDGYLQASEASTVQQQSVDQDIIDAKLKVSELLSERDSIARDLARARRALNETDEALETPMSGSTNDSVHSAPTRSDERRTRSSTIHENGTAGAEEASNWEDLNEEQDVEELQRILANEMERLRLAQEKLVEVVDETNSATKKRRELQEKVKVAQDEW